MSAEILLSTIKEQPIPVGDGMLYKNIVTEFSCNALVTSPRTPSEFLLLISYDDPNFEPTPDLCRSLVPQAAKVMKAVGW
ncbi:hypothetical protein [Gordonia phthalatica]|uniref:hypothetical protein n=1 Tax=Gordonia phthalatica TaxID=1136941 RepID=UPI0012FEEC1A|nr:hypothetical protein [Gordonia phthalatica]